MKPNFTESPQAWLRASRTYQTPAEYASSVEAFQRRGHAAALYVGGVILAVLGALVVAGFF